MEKNDGVMNKVKIPKVSVIVPVYNVEKYLEKCLESILSQTLQEIEIICIDDGSNDRSGGILDAYADKDARIRVFHRKNAGYGVSMNIGLDVAKGEYIGIVESDDYILPEMYERLYYAANQNSLDMVKSEAFYWLEKDNLLSRIHSEALNWCLGKVLNEWDKNLFFEFYMNIWTGIYRRDFLLENNIRFHETPGASYQDNGFWLLTCVYAKKAMWLNEAFYYYRQDNPTASIKDTGKIMAMAKEYDYIENQLVNRGLQNYLPYCYRYRIIRNLSTYFRISDEQKQNYCEFLRIEYKKYMPYIQKSGYYNRRFVALLKEPKQTTEWIIEKKKETVNKLRIAQSIIIYGAGAFGEKTFRVIANEGFSDKVKRFAVTQNKAEKVIANRGIELIETTVEKYPEALYVIGVSQNSRAYTEMTEKLKQLKVTFILDGNDLEDFFYVF